MIHVALFGIGAGLSVLLTYLVHSTAWIAGALLLTRYHRGLSPAARHVVWRAALLGPLASSTLSPGFFRCWQWALSDEGRAAAAPQAAALRPLPLASNVALVPDTSSPSAPFGLEVLAPLPWFTLFAGCWAVVALVLVLLIARAAVRQRRELALRTRVTHAAGIEALERLAKRAGIRHPVRLSRCAAASTPLVLSAREICLPERALELDQGALEAVLAHELAHIERRDGLWLNGSLFLQALLWFQPLNRKARAELWESAELAADDRAVELTGDALGLARTLTHVASWVSSAPLAPSVAMARAGSPIVERVARLVESSYSRPGTHFGSRTPWLALAALAAIGACSPSVGAPSAAEPRAGQTSSNPENPDGTQLVPLVASNPPPLVAASPQPPSVPADAAPNGADPHDGDADDELAKEEIHDRARHRRVASQGPAKARKGPPHAAPSASGDPNHLPMPPLPIQGMVSEIVAGVVPRAVEFSSTVTQLAMKEQQLAMQLERAEQTAAQPGASAQTRDEITRLKQELAASAQQREQLERDFEAHMDAWGKDFEQRFGRDHAPRMAAWGEDFGRRMEEMGKRLERQLSGWRAPSIPPPPAPPHFQPSPSPKMPQLAPQQPNTPARPATPPPARPATPPPAQPPANPSPAEPSAAPR